jgi:hypothetical protein
LLDHRAHALLHVRRLILSDSAGRGPRVDSGDGRCRKRRRHALRVNAMGTSYCRYRAARELGLQLLGADSDSLRREAQPILHHAPHSIAEAAGATLALRAHLLAGFRERLTEPLRRNA